MDVRFFITIALFSGYLILWAGYNLPRTFGEEKTVSSYLCDKALEEKKRVVIWYNLNTIYSFTKPYRYYLFEGKIYQSRYSQENSIKCYQIELAE